MVGVSATKIRVVQLELMVLCPHRLATLNVINVMLLVLKYWNATINATLAGEVVEVAPLELTVVQAGLFVLDARRENFLLQLAAPPRAPINATRANTAERVRALVQVAPWGDTKSARVRALAQIAPGGAIA